MCLFIFLAVVSLLILQRKQDAADNSTIRFYSKFLQRMARAGHPKAPHETGQEFAEAVRSPRGSAPNMRIFLTPAYGKYYLLRFRK